MNSNYADFGLVSPDGKTIAYLIPQDGIWVRPAEGGVSRIALPSMGGLGDDFVLWTPDSQWVASATGQPAWHTEEFHLARVSDGQSLGLLPPEEVGSFVGKSADGKKLLYYHCSLEPRLIWKVFPVSGGPALKIDSPAVFGSLMHHVWSPDSTSIAAAGESIAGSEQMWSLARTGQRPVQFDLKPLGTNAYAWHVSPDHRKLLYLTTSGTNQATARSDFHVAPISLEEGRTTGPGALVFQGWRNPGSGLAGAWSPDATKIAMPTRGAERNELWILSADGGKHVRIVETLDRLGNEVQWSPDGRWIAFNLIAADRKTLAVIPAYGGTVKTMLATSVGESVPFAWSPESKEVAVACDRTISGFPISGGSARVIVSLPEAGCEKATWLGWSPNGRYLAFYGSRKSEANRLCLFSRDSGRITTLDDRLSDSSVIWTSDTCAWSPDSKWILCATEEAVKVRPAGVIRELDVAELVGKAASATLKKPIAATNAPPAEPVIGPVFADNFDDGPSKHWRFQDLPDTGWGPGRHAVQNGELLLSHARACLDVNSWTDYLVRVRVCLKEVMNSREGNFGIAVRSTPSGFGSSRRDRYDLGVFGDSEARRYFWLGINYADASDTLRHGELARSPCTFALDKWYTLELEVRGRQLRGYLDGKLVVESRDDRLTKGGLWIGAGGARAHFDDFSVRQLP